VPTLACTDSEIENCFDVMLELRPHLLKDKFLSAVRDMQTQGFRLAYIEDQQAVVAVAGYRITTTLFMGKNLYVDDLITTQESRSKGYGEEMVSWLRDIAKNNDCNFIHLDSGTHRSQAHKF